MGEPLATTLLILATFMVSLLAFNDQTLVEKYIFRPKDILADKEYYRLVSCAFLHGGWVHLFLNLYTLHSFGGVIEGLFGPISMLEIYFGSVVGGSLLSLYVHRNHDYAAYGASGGVCGLIFAVVLKYPHSHMSLFPLPYAVPGWLYAIAFLIASFYAMKAGRDNIGHDAHLGGAIVGLLIAALLQGDLVSQHWTVFGLLLLVSGLLFVYLLINPLFLPLETVISKPSWPSWMRATGRASRSKSPGPRPMRNAYPRVLLPPRPEPDWLIAKIEVQVGELRKAENRPGDWLDKFGRIYRVVTATPQTFQFEAFRKEILEQLSNPAVQFVIVDSRPLNDSQVALIRPFLADLPDAQFNRVLRSYAF